VDQWVEVPAAAEAPAAARVVAAVEEEVKLNEGSAVAL